MKRHITNIISTFFGKFASCRFPYLIQIFVNKSYVYLMKLDMREYADSVSYKSLNELFTRSISKPRNLEEGFISPCDGLVSEQGHIEDFEAFQIKGMSYNVETLLGDFFDSDHKRALKKGSFLNLYLSPRDYHRFHAPCNMKVLKSVQISGKLYPVNFSYLNKVSSLFCENERVILECKDDEKKRFYLVFVGALNVGKIIFTFDKNIHTNAKIGRNKEYEYDNISLKKGDELGRFEMGSTIVLLFENEKVNFEKGLEKIRFGDKIVSF